MGEGDQRVGHQAGLVHATAHDRAFRKLQFVHVAGIDLETRGRAASSSVPFLPRYLWSRSGSESKTEVLLILDVQRI